MGISLQFPFEIGDIVYQIDIVHKKINEKKIQSIKVYHSDIATEFEIIFAHAGSCIHSQLGRYVFSTREAAEEALKRMQEKNARILGK